MDLKKMKNNTTFRKILFFFVLIVNIGFLFFALPHNIKTSRAGFGIAPPYLKNDKLTPGSFWEQKIILTRSAVNEDSRVQLQIHLPRAENWLSVDKGTEFILPKNQNQIPIVFSVKVPPKAELGIYQGYIRVRTSKLSNNEAGTVTSVLGGEIAIDLTVVDNPIFDFKIKGISAEDAAEKKKFLWMDLPGKIKLSIRFENTGNIPAAPSRVVLEIYSAATGRILKTIQNSNKIKKIEPFRTETVIAELPNFLGPGKYPAVYKIYKNEELAAEGQIEINIRPIGTIKDGNYEFFTLAGLNLLPWRDKIILVLFFLLILAISFFLFRQKRNRNILRER